ncbi:MAG: GGDEF domain-containing protein [Aureliella sp.]
MTPQVPGSGSALGPQANHCDIEETLVRNSPKSQPSEPVDHQECCLVQIYPTDIVDGMILLDDELFVVGRDPTNELCLPDSSVSRVHAEFKPQQNGHYRVTDLNSTNGITVNEQQVDSQTLVAGDTIQIGCYLFKFLAAGSVESQYHETVYSALTTDALTGAMNKRYMQETLDREIARARRQDTELAIVMLDIDHFKSINDTHGHLVGDEVLREFSARIHNICREDDLFARYGGEEFCLCTFFADRREVQEITQRCLQAVAQTAFDTTAGPLKVTASFGVAFLSEHPDHDRLGIIGEADKKLYEAKSSGRNRICF